MHSRSQQALINYLQLHIITQKYLKILKLLVLVFVTKSTAAAQIYYETLYVLIGQLHKPLNAFK